MSQAPMPHAEAAVRAGGLLPYQQRVVTELAELQTKVDGLRVFIGSQAFGSVAFAEQARMARQLAHMQNYAAVLAERIEAFAPPLTGDDEPDYPVMQLEGAAQ